MNKILKTALLSTIILTACGNKEEPIEEPIIEDVAEKSVVKPEIIDEDTDNKEVERSSSIPMSKDFERLQDSYFYKETAGYRMNVPETHIEDAKEIAGLYTAKQTNEEDEEGYPLTVLLDVKEDGTFTRYSYKIHENDEESLKDKNKYIDQENNVQSVGGALLVYDTVEVTSGYVVEAYGEQQLHAFESVVLRASFNQSGDIEFLDILNNTNEESFHSHVEMAEEDGVLLDDFGHSVSGEVYTAIQHDDINYKVFLNDINLKSAHQIQTDVNIMARDRANEMEKGIEHNTEFPEDSIYFLNNNELFQYLVENSMNMSTIITDTEEYRGYTLDNREMAPEIVFLEEERHVALFEHGETLVFTEEDNTWSENYYSK